LFDDLTLQQLLILQRALLEAKFSPAPRDAALQGSPILADLATAVLDKIRDKYSEAGDAARVRQWSDWARWSTRGFERRVIEEHLRGLAEREQPPAFEREAHIRALIAPFEASDDEIGEVIRSTGLN